MNQYNEKETAFNINGYYRLSPADPNRTQAERNSTRHAWPAMGGARKRHQVDSMLSSECRRHDGRDAMRMILDLDDLDLPTKETKK